MKLLEHTRNLLPKDGRAVLIEGFYPDDTASHIFEKLLRETAWQQQSVKIFGKWRPQPRLTAWYSEINTIYRYSSLDLHPKPFNFLLKEINQKIATQFDLAFNSALLNLYRNGFDTMGWHRDNERILGRHPTIASLSLGAPRVFRMRHFRDNNLKISVPLTHGSLLIMTGKTQDCWSHCLPKATKVLDARINITFRKIIEPSAT